MSLEGHQNILESSYLDEKEISPKVDTSNFFIESSYTDKANRTKCKGVVKHDGLKVNGICLSLIPEADIYRLIFGSKLPQAEQFQDWVFEEVLPTLRKKKNI